MNIDFRLLKGSIGKELNFEVFYRFEGNINFLDRFYAHLREVGDDFIIVEQYFVKTNENNEDVFTSHKRRLIKDGFEIGEDTPINP